MLNPIGIRDGKIIHISNLKESERGYKCGCICPQCSKQLIARMGEKNVWHFAHETDVRCDFGFSNSDGESPIHKYAKQILLEEMKVRIDEITLVEFKSIEAEHREGDTILDILGVNESDEELGIEIYYKHKVDFDKIEKLKKRYNNVLEIDIPALVEQDFLDDKVFRRKIINEYPREMIVNKGYQNNLEYRLEQLKKEEARIKVNKEEALKEISKRKKYLNSEEFRLNEKLRYISNLKKSKENFELMIDLKKKELEDLNNEINEVNFLLEDSERKKREIYEDFEHKMKAKEIELGLREHSIDRIEKENVRLKEQIKMINFKEMELNSKEKKLMSLEIDLKSQQEEQENYYKHKRKCLDERAEELDVMGRNLVKNNKLKWLDELYSKDLITEEQLLNIKNNLNDK
ncbi:MAG: hypothetical protein MR520_01960 [Mollicutes bacterium]|nr:hypothetical protein [Mollicutes bacterium]